MTCPICAAATSRRRWTAAGRRVHRCGSCGLEWFDPAGYASDHTHQYLEDRTSPVAYYSCTANCDRAAFGERMRVLVDAIGRRSGRVLDVGCSTGTFLQVAEQHGWEAVGVEPNPRSAAIARSKGLTVHNAFFDDALASQLGWFDAVHMSDVIEHVFDPVGLLDAARERLVPDGVVLVATPDFDTLSSRALQRKPKEHVVHFRRRSLAEAAARAGLDVIGIERIERPRSIAAMQHSTTLGPFGRALLRAAGHRMVAEAMEWLLRPAFRDTLLLSARKSRRTTREACA